MKTALLAILLIFLSGCTMKEEGLIGNKTGINYTIVYKVVKSGVVTFMTPEQIRLARLDKADLVITDTYKLVEESELGNDVE